MIQINTNLNVIDNSGAKVAYCIGLGLKKKFASTGDIIVVSIKNLRNKRKLSSKVLKGDILHALIVRTKFVKFNKFTGDSFYFKENAVVLLTRQNKFLFTRIFGVIPNYFRYSKYLRILSMSSGNLN